MQPEDTSMNSRTRIVANLLLGASLLSTSCSSGVIKSLGDMARLRQQLMDKYHEKDISVSVQNSRFMQIAFINSPLNQRDRAERQARARETAEFAKSHYPGIGGIQTIWIAFWRTETRYVFVHYNDNIDSYAFDKNGFELGGDSENNDPSRPIAKFSAARNETDVSITRLQLEGDLNHGLAMVPHFTVHGNLNASSNKLASPESVTVDFASYADKKLFPTDAKLAIDADDKTIFSGRVRLLRSADSGAGNDSLPQFLTAQIPFPQFLRLANAKQVRIRLGSRGFPLTSEALDSLNEMCDYVALPNSAAK